jgi:5-methyltetrahydropteroyltriglutamate--homocysteine methyltransferase
MPDSRPPFRADHVGSFLRPAAWKEARKKFESGAIDAAALAAVEDKLIEQVIAKQAEVGLKLATDGDFRRATWHNDFFAGLGGCEGIIADHGVQFAGKESTRKSFRVIGKIEFGDHPAIEHFKFLAAHSGAVPKYTIPAPGVAHFRRGASLYADVYPDAESFFADFGRAYADGVEAFYDAGCRYLQFDDTAWAHLGSDRMRDMLLERGDDPDEIAELYARTVETALAVKPADMTITTHLCHGNFQSSWSSEGDYEKVAEILLSRLAYDGYFLEYDSERSGGFEPLRYLPKGNKRVVLGIVTSKSGELEPKDAVKRRIDTAVKYIDLDQCCLSPQCGFASTEEGNLLSEDQQWAKLRHIVEIAREVWGES